LRSTPFTPLLSLPLVTNTDVQTTVFSRLDKTAYYGYTDREGFANYLLREYSRTRNLADSPEASQLETLDESSPTSFHPENDQWGSSATVLPNTVSDSYQTVRLNGRRQCLRLPSCRRIPHTLRECIDRWVSPTRSRNRPPSRTSTSTASSASDPEDPWRVSPVYGPVFRLPSQETTDPRPPSSSEPATPINEEELFFGLPTGPLSYEEGDLRADRLRGEPVIQDLPGVIRRRRPAARAYIYSEAYQFHFRFHQSNRQRFGCVYCHQEFHYDPYAHAQCEYCWEYVQHPDQPSPSALRPPLLFLPSPTPPSSPREAQLSPAPSSNDPPEVIDLTNEEDTPPPPSPGPPEDPPLGQREFINIEFTVQIRLHPLTETIRLSINDLTTSVD